MNSRKSQRNYQDCKNFKGRLLCRKVPISENLPMPNLPKNMSECNNKCYTFLDGITGSNWFYSVGNSVNYNGGNPAYLYSTGIYSQGKVAQQTQLFVCMKGSIACPTDKLTQLTAVQLHLLRYSIVIAISRLILVTHLFPK